MRPKALHEEERTAVGDMTVAKRQCDPKNFVTDPNEYGWVRVASDCKPRRVKGAGAKQLKDAPCE